MICKSGNLLCMHRVDASDESFHSKTIMGYGMSENFRLDFRNLRARFMHCIKRPGKPFQILVSPVLSQAPSSA